MISFVFNNSRFEVSDTTAARMTSLSRRSDVLRTNHEYVINKNCDHFGLLLEYIEKDVVISAKLLLPEMNFYGVVSNALAVNPELKSSIPTVNDPASVVNGLHEVGNDFTLNISRSGNARHELYYTDADMKSITKLGILTAQWIDTLISTTYLTDTDFVAACHKVVVRIRSFKNISYTTLTRMCDVLSKLIVCRDSSLHCDVSHKYFLRATINEYITCIYASLRENEKSEAVVVNKDWLGETITEIRLDDESVSVSTTDLPKSIDRIPTYINAYRYGDESVLTELEILFREDIFSRLQYDVSSVLNLFPSIKNSACVAGGAALDHVMKTGYSDVDVFFVGMSEVDFMRVPRMLYDEFRRNRNKDMIYISFQAHCINIRLYTTKVQFILRNYKSVTEVLNGFDVDICCVALYQNQIYFNSRFYNAAIKGYNVIDPLRVSPTYEIRLRKYAARGFNIFIPHYDRRLDQKIVTAEENETSTRSMTLKGDSINDISAAARRKFLSKGIEVNQIVTHPASEMKCLRRCVKNVIRDADSVRQRSIRHTLKHMLLDSVCRGACTKMSSLLKHRQHGDRMRVSIKTNIRDSIRNKQVNILQLIKIPFEVQFDDYADAVQLVSNLDLRNLRVSVGFSNKNSSFHPLPMSLSEWLGPTYPSHLIPDVDTDMSIC